MKDILFMLILGFSLYAFVRFMLKLPIIPWKERKNVNTKQIKNSISKANKAYKKSKNKNIPLDQEPLPFENLFDDLIDISHHMIFKPNDEFIMIAEVEPVNYFLKSQDEQETIDSVFETALAIMDIQQIYLQNRFVDLSEAITKMADTLNQSDDMPDKLKEYGQTCLRDINNWQYETERYDTKRYIIFSTTIDRKAITVNIGENLEEKVIDKAFSELYRKVSAAKNHFKKSENNVHMLSGEGIAEMLYHCFNRKKALKNKFRFIAESEQMALYVTSEQQDKYIEKVKELIISEGNPEEKRSDTATN